MHENLEKIKSLEGQPKIIKNFLNSEEIELFLKLYNDLLVAYLPILEIQLPFYCYATNQRNFKV